MKPTRLTLLTCHSALLFLAAPARGQPHPDPLSRLESGPDYQPRSDDSLVAFSLEDADLPELVRVIGQLTGKRFIFGGKVHGIKATIFSPQKVTVAEAYQAFLSILDANGLTVIPHGRFYKIVEAPDARSVTPVYVAGQASTGDERYVTRLHRLQHGNADEMAAVLGHLKSKDGDIVVYGPGNLLIITDTGSNIQRMVRVLEDMDVGGVGNQVWIEPIHYGAAADVATRLAEVFDIRPGASGAGKDRRRRPEQLPGDRRHRARLPAGARAHQATRSALRGGRGRDPRGDAPARRRHGSVEEPQRDHQRRVRRRCRPRRARRDRRQWRPGDPRVQGQGQRRQGHQLDHRHGEHS
jgi:hypothetical protein